MQANFPFVWGSKLHHWQASRPTRLNCSLGVLGVTCTTCPKTGGHRSCPAGPKPCTLAFCMMWEAGYSLNSTVAWADLHSQSHKFHIVCTKCASSVCIACTKFVKLYVSNVHCLCHRSAYSIHSYTSFAALGSSGNQHAAPRASSAANLAPNLTCRVLIAPSVGYWQPKPSKPFGVAKVIQEVGHFGPKVCLHLLTLHTSCTLLLILYKL
jgi:hypothetical protein